MARPTTQAPLSPTEADSAAASMPPVGVVAVPPREEVPISASVTWLGDDTDPETTENEFMGITFPKGKAVKVEDNPRLIAKARSNRFFKVS